MQDQNRISKLPITAFVASHNEAHLLEQCLLGLKFCSEIIVIDLDSDDSTGMVASGFGAKIFNYPKFPVVEMALHRAIPHASFDWILLTDPDEVIDQELAKEIFNFFSNDATRFQAARVPVQFYFKNHALRGTVWGGREKSWRLLYNRKYITTTETVHEGVKMKEGAETLVLKRTNCNAVVHHFWMTSFSSLFEKHKRYIREEGKRLYNNGTKYSITGHCKIVWTSFKYSYWIKRGYLDGLIGVFLSLFWAYYNFVSWNHLYLHSKGLKK